jgi:NIMA (never in mitosis gene a)-related kinase
MVVEKCSSNIYALKKISLSNLSVKQKNDALREVQIMQKLNHSSIIKYIDSFLDGNTLAIVMEYAEGGDLNRVL